MEAKWISDLASSCPELAWFIDGKGQKFQIKEQKEDEQHYGFEFD